MTQLKALDRRLERRVVAPRIAHRVQPFFTVQREPRAQGRHARAALARTQRGAGRDGRPVAGCGLDRVFGQSRLQRPIERRGRRLGLDRRLQVCPLQQLRQREGARVGVGGRGEVPFAVKRARVELAVAQLLHHPGERVAQEQLARHPRLDVGGHGELAAQALGLEIARVQAVGIEALERGEQGTGARGVVPQWAVGALQIQQRGGLVGRRRTCGQAPLEQDAQRIDDFAGLDDRGTLGAHRGALHRARSGHRHLLRSRRGREHQRGRCRERYKTFAQKRAPFL